MTSEINKHILQLISNILNNNIIIKLIFQNVQYIKKVSTNKYDKELLLFGKGNNWQFMYATVEQEKKKCSKETSGPAAKRSIEFVAIQVNE